VLHRILVSRYHRSPTRTFRSCANRHHRGLSRLGDVSGDAKQRSIETSSEGAMEETPRFLGNKHASTGASAVVSDEKRLSRAKSRGNF
jgi:hypothetical protein